MYAIKRLLENNPDTEQIRRLSTAFITVNIPCRVVFTRNLTWEPKHFPRLTSLLK